MPAHPKPEPKAKAGRSIPKRAEKAPEAAGAKTALLLSMLRRPEGATSKQMEEALGWQPHSVRGMLGTLRKRGMVVISTKEPKLPTVYSLAVGDVV